MNIAGRVFVPYRGFRFLILGGSNMANINKVFVPYRGFRFLITVERKDNAFIITVFVPYRGFRFLIACVGQV